MKEIRLHNRSGDLLELLSRKRSSTPVVMGCAAAEIRIYFYEFSCPHNRPLVFCSIEAFDSYLVRCGIEMKDFQSTILRVLGTSYVMCKEGTKDLFIVNCWASLANYYAGHRVRT